MSDRTPPPLLELGSQFCVDANLATRRGVLIGQPNVGKTNGLTRIAEEFLKIHVPVCILDWKGDLWGIRSTADGKGDGFAVVIFGGDHADIDIEDTDGREIGYLVAQERMSALIDFSGFVTDRSRRRFATAFLKAFFAGKARVATPHALLIDEYQQFAPERPAQSSRKDDEGSALQLLTATENVVGLGRKRGIGVIGTAHRAAQLNKNVVELSDIYFFMQIAGRNDIRSIAETIRPIATPEELELLRSDLPQLGVGEVVIYSPGWLRLLEKRRFGLRETFDSSRTPALGLDLSDHVPTSFASIDLPRLRDRIEATREKREHDDPEILRKRIIELENRHLGDPRAQAELDRLRLEVVQLREAMRTKDDLITGYDRDLKNIASILATATALLADRNLGATGTAAAGPISPSAGLSAPQQANADGRRTSGTSLPAAPEAERAKQLVAKGRTKGSKVTPETATSGPSANAAAQAYGPAAGKILAALAAFPDGSATRAQLAALTGYSVRQSTLRIALSTLRVPKLIETSGNRVQLTALGRRTAGPAPNPKSTADTIAMWRVKLRKVKGPAPVALLDTLVSVYPQTIDRAELGARANVDVRKSTFRIALSALRIQGLLEETGTMVRASSSLFPTGKLRNR